MARGLTLLRSSCVLTAPLTALLASPGVFGVFSAELPGIVTSWVLPLEPSMMVTVLLPGGGVTIFTATAAACLFLAGPS